MIYTLTLYTSQHHPILQEIFHIQNLDFTWDWCNMQTPGWQHRHPMKGRGVAIKEPARLRSHGTWYISCIITHVFMHIYTHLYTSIHIYTHLYTLYIHLTYSSGQVLLERFSTGEGSPHFWRPGYSTDPAHGLCTTVTWSWIPQLKRWKAGLVSIPSQ